MMKERVWIFILGLSLVTQADLYSQQLEVEGDIDLKDHQVINLANPTNDLDAATKAYADQLVLQFVQSIVGSVQEMLDDGVDPLAIVRIGVPLDSLYGKSYQGGLIFYLDDQDTLPEITGMVAAPMDQSSGATWGCPATFVDGADGTTIGTGNQNSWAIFQDCYSCCFHLNNVSSVIAAVICENLSLNGYYDWYLPSKDELNAMYLQIGQGAMGSNHNLGGFTGNSYWSSSEDLEFNTLAHSQTFSHGGTGAASKSSEYSVRAVRAF